MKKCFSFVLLAFAIAGVMLFTRTTEVCANNLIPVEYTDSDYVILPDKYNTGADVSAILMEGNDANALKSMYGLPFKMSSSGLAINFYGGNPAAQYVLIENVDFSNQDVIIYNADKLTSDITVVFRNCIFKGFRGGSTHFSCLFYNCSFEKVDVNNSILENCYIGGGQSDGIRACNDATFRNCYIADKSQKNTDADAGNHTDGTQIFGAKGGTCGNIHYENCRFELPQMTNSSAYVNACLMLQIEFCDADDITFTDCKINGGGYAIYAWSKKDLYQLTNASFKDISIGCASKWGNIYSRIGENVVFDNVANIDELYVGSIWNENGFTHISVTNDTNVERSLEIWTNNGVQHINIPACPLHESVPNNMIFSDFPFDIDVAVELSDWVVCYDITNEKKQIRYANFSETAVYCIDGIVTSNACDEVYENKVSVDYGYIMDDDASNDYDFAEIESSVYVASGKCGTNVTWGLTSDGTLYLEGTGTTEDYHSAKLAPWTDYIDEINAVVVSEGITRLGAQLFKNCRNLTYVQLPSTLTTLGKLVFQKCGSLSEIELPAALNSIGDRCFSATGITDASFLGGDWSNINIGVYNELLSKAFH